eukprot:394733_1
MVSVFLYVPNIVGYIRIMLCIWGISYMTTSSEYFLLLQFINCCLDYVDGYLARKLNQKSRFGALFDVVIDNLTRNTLWVGALYYRSVNYNSTPFWLIFCVIYYSFEAWCTFLCTQLQATEANSHWKSNSQGDPEWILLVFANGFKNRYGFFVIGSTFTLPFLLVLSNTGYHNHWFVVTSLLLSFPSRILCSICCWYLQWKYISVLAMVDAKQPKKG